MNQQAARVGTTSAQLRSCDVLVVGAGPAGIEAARAAALGGASVILLESAPLPRKKSCGGMLNEYAQNYLAEVSPVPRSLVLDPEWVTFRYYDWDRRIIKPCSLRFLNIDRALFDEWLLSRLPDSVDVVDRTPYVSSTEVEGGVEVRAGKGDSARTFFCRVLVGADGARSEVRRSHGDWPQTKCYKTVQEIVKIDPGTIEPHFDCIYSRSIGKGYGYGYIVPKGDVAIIGSVFYPGAKGIAEEHMKAVELFGERYPFGTSCGREAGTAIKVSSNSDVLGSRGRILMAGEAAGLMSPSSGEGISFALNTGRLAGEAAAAGLASPQGPSARYEAGLKPIRKTIAHRLRAFPIMDSAWGKWLGGCMPTALVSRMTEHL